MKNLQNIPLFPDFTPISFRYKKFLQKKLWNYQPQASEYNFTNLFMWKEYFKLKFSVLDQWLLILSEADPEHPYFFQPVGPGNRAAIVYYMLSWLQKNYPAADPVIKRADQRLIDEIQNDQKLGYTADRDYFDYIYNTRDLIHLKGQKYHSKRNHLKQFYNKYEYTYKNLNIGTIDACKQIEEKWCKHKGYLEKKQIQTECEAIMLLLNSYQSLKIPGGIIYINEKPVAFAIGELLNQDMAVIHIEKADQKIKGLYQLINQKFCEKNWGNITFVNREQDLGLKGLRKAKKSYYPAFLAEKYIIYKK